MEHTRLPAHEFRGLPTLHDNSCAPYRERGIFACDFPSKRLPFGGKRDYAMKTLHRSRGLHHDLVVTQNGNTITLWSAAGVRHTVLDLDAPHIPGLEYARNTLLALAFHPQASSFLILGLGGGSIPRMLHAAVPGASIDAVEIDPAIPELALKYFQTGASQRFRVYVEDAAAYVAHCGLKYDIIILDAYVGEMLPEQCATREFFENTRKRLTERGVLVINWMRSDPLRFRLVMTNTAESVGPCWLLRGYRSRNTLIFSSGRETTRAKLVTEAERLGDQLLFASAIVRLARRIQPYQDE